MDAQERLRDLAVSESGFLFDPRTGRTYSLNETGTRVLALLREGETLETITDALEEAFEVSHADVRRDVLEFVGQMREYGILPREFEP